MIIDFTNEDLSIDLLGHLFSRELFLLQPLLVDIRKILLDPFELFSFINVGLKLTLGLTLYRSVPSAQLHLASKEQ